MRNGKEDGTDTQNGRQTMNNLTKKIKKLSSGKLAHPTTAAISAAALHQNTGGHITEGRNIH